MSRLPSFRRALPVAIVLVATLASACVAAVPSGRFASSTYGVERIDGLQYGSAVDEWGQQEDLHLTMFRPTGPADGPRPAIVFIHSGAFTGGLRSEQDDIAREYAERGYVTVTITYRLREGAWIWFNSPSDIALGAARDARHDAQAAVRWLRSNADAYGIDSGHIGAVGYSAGAITALGLAQFPEDPGDSGNPGPSSKICVAVSISGIAAEGAVESDDAPVLMFHGGDDFIVPTRFARETAWNAGVHRRLASYVELPGVGHGVFYQSRKQITPKMVDVLRQHLVDGPPCV